MIDVEAVGLLAQTVPDVHWHAWMVVRPEHRSL